MIVLSGALDLAIAERASVGMGTNPPIAHVESFKLLAALAAATCNCLILGAFTLDQPCNALPVTALKGKAKPVVHSIKSRSLGTCVVQ